MDTQHLFPACAAELAALDAQLARDVVGERHGVQRPLYRLYTNHVRWLFTVRGERWVKRAVDLVAGALLLIALAPVAALAALLIKLTDGGPVVYWQRRVGLNGRLFAFPKLRSMVVHAEQLRPQLEAVNDHRNGVTFKMRDDPRVTWIGRIIRKLSIDEVPQLWCVLAGDMSLVGPRPAVPSEVRRYTRSDRRRLDVVPGLTCLWQVSGRADLPFEKQVKLDVSYIRDRSLWMDLSILVRTVPAVLTGRGAY